MLLFANNKMAAALRLACHISVLRLFLCFRNSKFKIVFNLVSKSVECILESDNQFCLTPRPRLVRCNTLSNPSARRAMVTARTNHTLGNSKFANRIRNLFASNKMGRNGPKNVIQNTNHLTKHARNVHTSWKGGGSTSVVTPRPRPDSDHNPSSFRVPKRALVTAHVVQNVGEE